MRILPPRLFLLCVLAMAALWWWLPGPRIVPAPYNWGGVFLVVAGLSISVLGSRQFSRARTNILTFNDPDALVRDGLFALSRNPMYLGFALCLLGVAVALGTLTPLAAPATFVVVAELWYVRFEEKAMLRVFGEAYEDYRRKVRRWL